MAQPLGLATYLAMSGLLKRYANRQLASRLAQGKEDPDRIEERRGVAAVPRPDGLLIWFHAASVGESVSLLTLIDELLKERDDIHILVTTGTISSAELMAERLPMRAIHQYAPLDARAFVLAFLKHWKPDIAVWTESELWPALICETDKTGAPMMLLNARMSKNSHRYWRWFKWSAAALLRKFDMILAQDRQSADFLLKLGAIQTTLRVVGSLKESSAALPHNEAERADIAHQLQTRPVWLAASTHPGEEQIAAMAHAHVRPFAPRLLLIIAPRHPERGPEIAENLRADGWSVGLRSDGDELDTRFEIYVADTLGEMGLWYRLAPVSFVGGSLAGIGGHNPFEPAALGSAIIHGPHVNRAREVYARLTDAGGAMLVETPKELGRAVQTLLEPHVAAEMAHAAWEVSSSGAEASETARTLLLETLDEVERKNATA